MKLDEKDKRGKRVSQRISNAFWDAVHARTDSELKDLLAWAMQMSNTNCGWDEFALKEVFIRQIPEVISDRVRLNQ